MNNTKLRILFALIASLALVGAGFYIGQVTVGSTTILQNKVLREGGYTYINPVLLCNTNNSRLENEQTALKDKIETYVNQSPEKDVAAYFLNLQNGQWAGVHEEETFSPASMLKVPAMVAILKYADSHADILSKEIYYDGSFDDNKAEHFKLSKAIQPNHSYTIDQLLTYMIVNSDNNAARLLNNALDANSFASIYISLGVQIPPGTSDFMSPKTYSLFLRVLYNSTYLTREMSEKALRLMIQPDFPQGLYTGVPSLVEVAQKFGERWVVNMNGAIEKRELHDCGIVYAQNNPYILCIMTRGNDFDALATEIKDISKIAFDYNAAMPQ